MIRRRTLGLGAVLGFIGSAGFLISGHPWLNWPSSGLPIGTVVAGVMVSALGAMPLAIAPTRGIVRAICLGILGLATAWLPVSLLLAGNWRLNFTSGPRAEWATALGLVTLAAIVAGVVLALGARGFERWRGRNHPQR
jgi:hypothetical protein